MSRSLFKLQLNKGTYSMIEVTNKDDNPKNKTYSSRDEGMGSNPGAVQKKKDNRETPGSHDLGVARPP